MNKADKSIGIDEVKKKPTDSKAGKIIWYCLLAVPIVWVVFTIIVPLAMGDGVNNFTGTKRGVAKAVMDYTNATIVMENHLPEFVMRYHVDNVYPTTTDEKTEFCKEPDLITNDPSKYTYYSVAMSKRQLGSLETYRYTLVGCQFRSNANRYFQQD